MPLDGPIAAPGAIAIANIRRAPVKGYKGGYNP